MQLATLYTLLIVDTGQLVVVESPGTFGCCLFIEICQLLLSDCCCLQSIWCVAMIHPDICVSEVQKKGTVENQYRHADRPQNRISSHFSSSWSARVFLRRRKKKITAA